MYRKKGNFEWLLLSTGISLLADDCGCRLRPGRYQVFKLHKQEIIWAFCFSNEKSYRSLFIKMAMFSRMLVTANLCHSGRIAVQRISSRSISTSCHCLASLSQSKDDSKEIKKPKIKSKEVWRLLSLAKPEKYNLGSKTFSHTLMFHHN